MIRLGRLTIPTAVLAFLASFAAHAGLIAAAFWIVHTRPWEGPSEAASAGVGDAGDGTESRLIPGSPVGNLEALEQLEPPESPEGLTLVPPPDPLNVPPMADDPATPPPEAGERPPPATEQPDNALPVIGVAPPETFQDVPPSRRAPPTGTVSDSSADAANVNVIGTSHPRRRPGKPRRPCPSASRGERPAPMRPPPVAIPSPGPVVSEACALPGSGGRRGRRGSDGLPAPDYPPASLRLGEQGVVVLEGEVLPDGTLGRITVVSDPGYPRLVKAAIEAFGRFAFEPKSVGGTRCRAPTSTSSRSGSGK